MSQVEELVKAVESVKENPVRVVFVTGKPGSGKSQVMRDVAATKKWSYIDCRLLITEKFLEVPAVERNVKAPEIIGEILASYDDDVIMLDRLQTLFIPVFNIDTDLLLKKLGKEKTIVAAWPGYIQDDTLCYDKFDGTESIRIPMNGYTVWNVE